MGRAIEPHFGQILVAERKREAIANAAQRIDIDLLLLMRGHPRLGVAEAVSLLGFHQDDGRLAAMPESGTEARVQLAEVVPAAF